MSIKKKLLSLFSAGAMALTAFTSVNASGITDENILIRDTQYDSGYTYINTFYKSAYYGKSAFKLTYEYVNLDSDGKYLDRDTNQETQINYNDTFEFLVFDTNWGGWNATKIGVDGVDGTQTVTQPDEDAVYTATIPISTIESKLAVGSTVQGINFETGRIGDTQVKIQSLELVNAENMTSSPVEFTGSWTKGVGGTLTKQSGTAGISSDSWNINITNLCVYGFKNPTIDVTVDYGNTAPNNYLQAEILSGISGKPIVENYPYVNRTGEVTYTTEFNANLTSLSVCYDGCTVKSIRIYDNTAGNITTSVTGKTANQIAENMGVAWNLGNALECVDGAEYITVDGNQVPNPNYGKVDETSWGNPVATKKLIQAVKAQGFNTIRVPVSYIDQINTDNTVNDEYLARIKQVVDYAYDMGMYVVINMHNDGGTGVHGMWLDITKTGSEFEAIKTKYSAVWSDIADYFKGYDQRLIFEGFNELNNGSYTTDPTTEQLSNVNTLNNAFVSAVRNAGGKNTDRVLIVAGYNANIDYTVSNFAKPNDSGTANRLMLSVHYYDPYDFTLNEQGTGVWDSDTSKISSQLDKIAEFANREEIDMPVFIGEYGAIDKNNISARAEYCYWLNYYAAQNEDCYIVTSYWDNGVIGLNGTAMFDRTNNVVSSEEISLINYIKAGYNLSSIPN